jgi:hypothetical protein
MSFPAPWRPASAPVFALSVGVAQVNATSPVSFQAGGGTCRIVNSGATSILVTFYNNASNGGPPVLTFPVTGAPPVGQPAISAIAGPYTSTLIVPGAAGSLGSVNYVDVPGNCDSFSAIGSAAGPSIIYLQKGEGTGP